MSAGYQPWFEKSPDLFELQKQILESAGFNLNRDILDRDRQVLFTGNSKNDPDRELIVAFPDAFPSAAPKIHDTPKSKLLTRHHRGDTRQLCLFGFSENRWDATKSVALALSESEELISQFKDGNTASNKEDQPPEPITRALAYAKNTAIIVPPPISTFTGFKTLKHPSGRFILKYVYAGESKRESAGRGIILEADFGAETLKCGQPFSTYLGYKGHEILGNWFYLNEQPTQKNLQAVVKECLRATKRAETNWRVLDCAHFRRRIPARDWSAPCVAPGAS